VPDCELGENWGAEKGNWDGEDGLKKSCSKQKIINNKYVKVQQIKGQS
jgi:hypothetical protein